MIVTRSQRTGLLRTWHRHHALQEAENTVSPGFTDKPIKALLRWKSVLCAWQGTSSTLRDGRTVDVRGVGISRLRHQFFVLLERRRPQSPVSSCMGEHQSWDRLSEAAGAGVKLVDANRDGSLLFSRGILVTSVMKSHADECWSPWRSPCFTPCDGSGCADGVVLHSTNCILPRAAWSAVK